MKRKLVDMENVQQAIAKKRKGESINDTLLAQLEWEDENSRLIAAVGGQDTLKKLQESSCLLMGLGGLGVEIAKNLVLMGISSLTIHDPENATMLDLSSNFYLSEDDIGINRAESCIENLRQLNERVELNIYNDDISSEIVSQYQIVVLTNVQSRDQLVDINRLCRENSTEENTIRFISTDCIGLFGFVFVDNGEQFIVHDKNGEQPKQSYISGIMGEENGKAIITVVENSKHDLEDGDIIRITEVEGLEGINNNEYSVKVLGPFQLEIDLEITGDTPYIKGGLLIEKKQPTPYSFEPAGSFFGKSLEWDKNLFCDDRSFMYYQLYYLYIQAYLICKGNLGAIDDRDSVAKVLNTIKELNEDLGESKIDITENEEAIVTTLAKISSGNIAPMAAIFGGLVAQQVITSATGKFTPINQWFFYEDIRCVDTDLPEEEFELENCRYDGQIVVFGKTFVDKIRNLNTFLVGAGAIGCEMLKNWAMMGVSSGDNGKITVTDMDTIEISNLNRQFLYRKWHINQLKSEVAANEITKMNPQLKIDSLSIRVGPETEKVLNDRFWRKLQFVAGALDNINARLYIDSRCVFFKKPMIDSGTEGPKGNIQVIVPNITESYGASPDPPETHVPLCTLHTFPNKIEHCIQWSREIFEDIYYDQPSVVENYINNPGFLDALVPVSYGLNIKILEDNVLNRPNNFDECIIWAYRLFEEKYNHNLKQILYTFPLDHIDDGAPFWSGSKRPPTPLEFDGIYQEEIMNFIVSSTFLKAYSSNIIESEFKQDDYLERVEYIKSILPDIEPIEFVPKDVKIETDENAAEDKYSTPVEIDITIDDLPKPEDIEWKPAPVSFEKDDDDNFHIDFISSAGNLRALAYGIEPVDRLKSKLIGGRIIPAIVTTTAFVTGLACLEMYNVVKAPEDIEQYRSYFLNLALPMFQISNPMRPTSEEFMGKEYTEWDKINVKGDFSVQNFRRYFIKNYKVKVDSIFYGRKKIYDSFQDKELERERLSKVIIKANGGKRRPYYMLSLIANDREGNNIPYIPPVKYWIASKK
eukprot:TRINITY_DN2563_c0_g4_i1.p1 TRINITY_DN2563_c0_g4~~TRINITY_DN2563_c0_g4_i1.p1  ORF type:complete len:1041 (+),score=296.06 TRINITY_DN2563_c0_g4_i1:205-3327(+)